jgi:Flp pilus assembly protein TadB
VDATHHRAATVSAASLVAGSAAAAAVVVATSRTRLHTTRPAPARIELVAGADPRRPSRRVVIGAVVLLGVVVSAVLGPIALVVGACCIAVWLTRRQSGQRVARQAIEAAMPDAIELMVVCLHAGLTPTQAIGELARLAPPAVRPGFVAVEQRLHRGAGFADALAELISHGGRSALAVVSALTTAVRDGLPLAPVLDRLTDEANAGRRRAGEAAARRLPVRLSFPLVVCTLPSFVLLAIAPAVLGALSTVRGSAP